MPYCLINHKYDSIPIFLKNILYQNQFLSTQNKASKIMLFILHGGFEFLNLAMCNTILQKTDFSKFQIQPHIIKPYSITSLNANFQRPKIKTKRNIPIKRLTGFDCKTHFLEAKEENRWNKAFVLEPKVPPPSVFFCLVDICFS